MQTLIDVLSEFLKLVFWLAILVGLSAGYFAYNMNYDEVTITFTEPEFTQEQIEILAAMQSPINKGDIK